MNRYSSARSNPQVLARGRPPRSLQNGMSGPTAPVGGQGTGRANPAPTSGLGSTSGLGAPIKQTGSMTLMATGASFPSSGRVLVDMEADVSPTITTACWSFYAALVGYPGEQLIDTHLEPITYGTCYHRWQFAGDLPSNVEEAEVWIWWADDIRGWFQAPPAFEQGVGTENLNEPPPAFRSDRFPLLTTEEGRERGVFEEETEPTVGAVADFGVEFGSALKDTLITAAIIAGGGALLWYGAPIITASAEEAAESIRAEDDQDALPEPEEEAADEEEGRSNPPEKKPPSAEKILAENRS